MHLKNPDRHSGNRERTRRKERRHVPATARRLLFETLEHRLLLSNACRAMDVNDDRGIGAIDALMVIDDINSGHPTARTDVNGDGDTTAVDALLVINEINAETHCVLNIAPQAADMALKTMQDEPLEFAPQASDEDGDALLSLIARTPEHGSTTVADGAIRYTPERGFIGTDTFTYRVDDGWELSNEATAQVIVTPRNHETLIDPELAALIGVYDDDGAITRTEMMELLQSTEDEDTVTTEELDGLQQIISSTLLVMREDIRALAGYVINGNPANAHYQGRELGNLQSGSSAAQMEDLIGKHFLGTDHPDAAGHPYLPGSGVLFVDGATADDVKQGEVPDCYLQSVLMSLADRWQKTLEEMFIANGDGTWTVRFFAERSPDIFEPIYVTVDAMLPADDQGNLVYGGAGRPAATTELWASLIEKGYAQGAEQGGFDASRAAVNAYPTLNGGWMEPVYEQIMGTSAASYWGFLPEHQAILDTALEIGLPVTVATAGYIADERFAQNHAYALIRKDGVYDLINPWGFGDIERLTFADLQMNALQFTVGNPPGDRLQATDAIFGQLGASDSLQDGRSSI